MDRKICKSLCAESLCVLNESVDLLSRHTGLSVCVDTTDRSAVLKSALEYNELAVFYNIRYVL